MVVDEKDKLSKSYGSRAKGMKEEMVEKHKGSDGMSSVVS